MYYRTYYLGLNTYFTTTLLNITSFHSYYSSVLGKDVLERFVKLVSNQIFYANKE